MSREIYENIFNAYTKMLRDINEDKTIQAGLNAPEPEYGKEYTEDEKTAALAPVLSALAALREKGIDGEADNATYRDLQDKKEKWENAGKDKPEPNTVQEPDVAGEEPAPEEEEPAPEEEEPAPEEDEEEKDKEKK